METADSRQRFATTSWSVVLQARGDRSGDQRAALEMLCQSYWYPLYSYLRRRGHESQAAEDLTQAFFVDLLEKQVLDQADNRLGRFRSFLLATLNHFVSNQQRIENALKRGGGHALLSLDFSGADERFQKEMSLQGSPDRQFLRQWALQILELAAESLQSQYEQNGKQQLYEVLRTYLSPSGEVAYADAAQQLGMHEGAIKVAVHRLRQRFGQEVRMQIAQTVQDPAEVDDELQHLFDALAD